MAEVPLVFIDTETTGLRRPWMPGGRRIWEVAAIRREPDGTTSSYHSMLPSDIGEADPFALSIGRFYERHPQFGGPINTQLDDEATAAWALHHITAGAHLVGAVPSFDEESLTHLLWANNLSPRWHYHLVDVETFAAGACGWEPPYNSDHLFAAFDIEIPYGERHTAMGDAQAAMKLYDAVVAYVDRNGRMPR